MKMKRIIRLALVLGVLFSLCGAAWADTKYFFGDVRAEYTSVFNVKNGWTKVIRLSAQVNALDTSEGNYITADNVIWTSSGVTVSFDEPLKTELNGTATVATAVAHCSTESAAAANAKLTFTATFKSGTGDASGGGNVTIGNQSITIAKTLPVTVDLSAEDGTDVRDDDFSGSWLDGTNANPDWDEMWDGIDLKLGGGEDGKRGPGSEDKPAVKSVNKTSFIAGTPGTAEVTITGAAPSAWVGITAKDAYKLGWLTDKPGKVTNADDIQLNKENIKKYSIPFRVTGYEMTESMKKGASSKLTLSYSGAKVSYKALPITVYAINSQPKKKGTTEPYKVDVEKAAKKTFKFNISETVTPGWVVASPDITEEDEPTTDFAFPPKGLEIALPLSADTVEALEGLDNMDNHNYAKIRVSADTYGPYEITVKPVDKTTGKSVKNGIEAEVTQPAFDKYGEVLEPGYVTFTANKDEMPNKETKTAFTLTATNPSTKKKAAAKVTVIAKIGPTIQNTVEIEEMKYLDPKKIKRVEAGKTPSVAVKAKGSKTIEYGLEYSGHDVWEKNGDAESPKSGIYSLRDAKALEADGWTRTTKHYEKLLADHKLSFDAKKGKIVLADKNDKATTPTLEDASTAWYAEHGETEEEPPAFNDDEKGFSSLDIEVFADNGYGRDDAYAQIGISGAKPAIYKTKTAQSVTVNDKTYPIGDKITISRDAWKSGDVAAVVSPMVNKQLVGIGASLDVANVKFTLAADKDGETLSGLGLELVDYYAMSTDAEIRELQTEIDDENDAAKKAELQAELDSAIQRSKFYNYGVLKVGSNGLGNAGSGKVNFTLENYGAAGKGGVTITLVDGGPEIAAIEPKDATFNADPSEDKTLDVSLKLTADTVPTNTKTVVDWKVGSNKLGNSANVSAVIAADKNSKGRDGATLTLTAKPTNDQEHGSFDVTATNKTNNIADVYEVGYYLLSKDQQAWPTTGVTVRYVGTFRTNGTAAPKAKAYAETAPEAEADDTAEAVDAVVFGAPRTLASLTAQQKAYLQSKGYVVVAVLDEFTAQADGQVQDFEAELDEEKATEGAKLVYIAFPQNAPEVEDDKIADFYDEDGAAIETVPASRKVVVAPWLRNGVTYQPVIAIEAE